MAEGHGTDKVMGLSPRSWRHISRAVQSGNVVLYLSAATVVVAAISAVVMWLSRDEAFPTIGTALWWAVVTVTTVGYGDVVPDSSYGRLIGSVLMVLGVTYVAFVTAVITSVLVSSESARVKRETDTSANGGESAEHRLHEAVDRVEQRLAAIERKLPG